MKACCFLLLLAVVGAQIRERGAHWVECSTSSQCGAGQCCVYNSNIGRRLLTPLDRDARTPASPGMCAPVGQLGSACVLQRGAEPGAACPCGAGLACTPGAGSVGVCTIDVGAGRCPVDLYTCPDGKVVGRIPPLCGFASCVCTLETRPCPNGRSVSRVPPSCDFAPCDSWPSVGCATDIQLCSNGRTVGRVVPNCEFAACGGEGVCPSDVLACPNSGYSVRRVPPSCAFASCNPEIPAAGVCPSGQMKCDGVMQSTGVQCLLDTCVTITPCYNHSMCGVGYYCYACSLCRASRGCVLSPACATSPLAGDCSAVANCLAQRNSIDSSCPWGTNVCAAVTCPPSQKCVPGAANVNVASETPQYSCQSSFATRISALSPFLLLFIVSML